jgi:predicted metal-dependent hydrolase
VDSVSYHRGIALFNEGCFFDAHEVLEDEWRAAPQAHKKFLQGLIQVAVALHHHSKGNLDGARSLMLRAAKNLSNYPDTYGGMRLSALRDSLAEWNKAMADGGSLPAMPKMDLT